MTTPASNDRKRHLLHFRGRTKKPEMRTLCHRYYLPVMVLIVYGISGYDARVWCEIAIYVHRQQSYVLYWLNIMIFFKCKKIFHAISYGGLIIIMGQKSLVWNLCWYNITPNHPDIVIPNYYNFSSSIIRSEKVRVIITDILSINLVSSFHLAFPSSVSSIDTPIDIQL